MSSSETSGQIGFVMAVFHGMVNGFGVVFVLLLVDGSMMTLWSV